MCISFLAHYDYGCNICTLLHLNKGNKIVYFIKRKNSGNVLETLIIAWMDKFDVTISKGINLCRNIGNALPIHAETTNRMLSSK